MRHSFCTFPAFDGTAELEGAASYLDPAAILAAASALRQACERAQEREADLNLSEAYQGFDHFLRCAMWVAIRFEDWACRHVHFEALDDVWPYLLEDRFAEACLAVHGPAELNRFGELDWLRVALRLRLPIRSTTALPVPIDEEIPTPVDSLLRRWRIQSVRRRGPCGGWEIFGW